MEGKKTYTYTKRLILEAVHDIVELQNGCVIISDAIHGKVLYRIAMYGYEWDILYTVREAKAGKCLVTIKIEGDRRDKAKEVRRQFALLDSMLIGDAQVEMDETEETEEPRRTKRPLKRC